MYIYHALINALSAHMIHINLNMIFYTHAEHSPTKTIYIKYYTHLDHYYYYYHIITTYYHSSWTSVNGSGCGEDVGNRCLESGCRRDPAVLAKRPRRSVSARALGH